MHNSRTIIPRFARYHGVVTMKLDYRNKIAQYNLQDYSQSYIANKLKKVIHNELQHNKPYADRYHNLITNAANLIEDDIIRSNVLHEIKHNTYYHSKHEWDITNLARKYNMTGIQVAYALANNYKQCSQIKYTYHLNTDHTKSYISPEFKTHYNQSSKKYNKKGYGYVYTYNGMAIMNEFPKNIFNNLTPLRINLNHYDFYNNDTVHCKIMSLLTSKIITNTVDTHYKQHNYYQDDDLQTQNKLYGTEIMSYIQNLVNRQHSTNPTAFTNKLFKYLHHDDIVIIKN
ncbi:MAG: hypothetical protein Gaeavirus11_7 [Gaeavirus sp.]|uniref:Uncharacterized protein n=1 Tax=Gaeavirus sp. TaxID=2487767 RepID=A0A3G4ZYZ2_9VIRU|nr:MAG: hypothetical protein Gaeavirus11_7 [Gaeavirus sp.]